MPKMYYINQYEAEEINVGYDSNEKEVYIELNDDFNQAYMYMNSNQAKMLIEYLQRAIKEVE